MTVRLRADAQALTGTDYRHAWARTEVVYDPHTPAEEIAEAIQTSAQALLDKLYGRRYYLLPRDEGADGS